MSYSAPKIDTIEVAVKCNFDADNKTSCAGGRCVRAPYENDPN